MVKSILMLSNEEYEIFKGLSKGEQCRFIEARLDISIICGYGYYGLTGRVIENYEEKCFVGRDEKGVYLFETFRGYGVEYYRGSSCD